MITATRTAITIEFYTGNMVCGSDAETIDAINLDATIADYCKRVEAELGDDYSVEWNLHTGEGPAMRPIGADVTEQISEDVWAAGEKVFNLGEFWINN